MYTMIEFIINDILSFHDELGSTSIYLVRREQLNNYMIYLQDI